MDDPVLVAIVVVLVIAIAGLFVVMDAWEVAVLVGINLVIGAASYGMTRARIRADRRRKYPP